MTRLFGTDGIRGTANIYPMNSEMALRLGRAAAFVFKNQERRHRILIGKDTRLSGYMLESALTSGICSMGVDVLLVGPLPTPGIAYITRSLRADAGIVISASHNPYQDNGIKFFSADGFKLPDRLERRMEKYATENHLEDVRPTADDVGKAFRVDDAAGRYVEFVKSTFPRNLDLVGLKVVVDSANGACYRVSPSLLRELGAEVVSLNDDPDGRNINHGCGSTHPSVVARAVVRHGADLGITHDGDGDRVLLADERGRVVDGDAILALAALDMKRQKTLARNAVVATVMSNLGLELALKKEGIDLLRTPVGDRAVVEEMRKGSYNLGGEQSGHIVFLDHQTTGDGIVTALQVLAVMRERKAHLSALASVVRPVPQVLLNVPVARKVPFEELPAVAKRVAEMEKHFAGSARILLRYSGTEPLARVMIEGTGKKRIEAAAAELAGMIARLLGPNEVTKGVGSCGRKRK
jgi:phosphoglucosamine mutase